MRSVLGWDVLVRGRQTEHLLNSQESYCTVKARAVHDSILVLAHTFEAAHWSRPPPGNWSIRGGTSSPFSIPAHQHQTTELVLAACHHQSIRGDLRFSGTRLSHPIKQITSPSPVRREGSGTHSPGNLSGRNCILSFLPL